ncbi:lysophospholipase, putative [Plasmodium ovale wallikeri]|uniref:Lysophospholipase, putative n=1 Tax=Plasmodium ovale wallikeri TaxID=864142 RepID=A0A1A9AR68_PLAOA|nr:lysophospholipase, putative [Plasmodium ovale wallikeri]
MDENEVYNEEVRTTLFRLDGKPTLDSFFNKDGLLLRTYGWLVKNAVGIIVLIHGLKSHARLTYLNNNVEIISNDKAILIDGNNYYIYRDSWIECFNKNKYSVYAIDLQGHGQSDGWQNLPANVNEFDDLVYDVIQYMNKIRDETSSLSCSMDSITSDSGQINCQKDIPIYLIGHSMGGNIALRTLQILGKTEDESIKKLNIKGCVSLSGMISYDKISRPGTSLFKFFYLPVTRIISAFIPTIRVVSEVNYTSFPFIIDLGNFDKFRLKKGVTCRFVYQLLRAMDNLDKDMENIPKDIPILFIHARDDCVCCYNGVESFYNRLNVNNKELYTLENMDHVITREPGNENVLKKVVEWLSDLPEEEEADALN